MTVTYQLAIANCLSGPYMQQKQELKQIAKRLLRAINKPLGLLGVEFTRKGANPMAFDRLQRLQKLGVSPKVIFDCGAYIVGWTADVSTIFRGDQFVLFEPNTSVTLKPKPRLRQFSQPLF